MVTVSGDTPAYRSMGELHFTDAEDNPIVVLCFVQERAIKGHENFALICSDTLVDMKADINHHAATSKKGNILPLKRLISQPYHYEDDSNTKNDLALSNDKLLHSIATESSIDAAEITPIVEQYSVPIENEANNDGATTEVMTEMDTEQLTEVEVLRITGRRLKTLRKTNKD